MKKKILFLTILFLTIRLFADEKILEDFINKINNKNEWIPIEYIQVINTKDRNTLKNIIPDYNYERFYDPFCEEWYEKYTIENLFFDDYIGLDGKWYNFIFFDNEWFYSIKKIESNLYVLLHQEPGSILNINTKFSQIGKISPLESLRKTPLYSEDPTYYDDEEYKFDEIIIDARFIFDGDYLTVNANEDKFKQVYFKCTEETYEQLKSLIYTNTIDLSKIIWPRHADGSCDYDETENL